MEPILIDLGISILGGVVAYYVCKWLDNRLK